MKPDFDIYDHGTVWVFVPLSEGAGDFAVEAFSAAQMWGRGYVVEHRFANDIIRDLLEREFECCVDGVAVGLQPAVGAA